MKKYRTYKLILLCLLLIGFNSCRNIDRENQKNESTQQQNEELFESALSKHLEAVANKDLKELKSTMSPNGKMELIQPGSEIVYSVDGFMQFHENWFGIPEWTVKTKILSMDVGNRIGVATTEFLYEEPERNGKPYFNRLIVSYTLEKINDQWYIIKDHASSSEKTE